MPCDCNARLKHRCCSNLAGIDSCPRCVYHALSFNLDQVLRRVQADWISQRRLWGDELAQKHLLRDGSSKSVRSQPGLVSYSPFPSQSPGGANRGNRARGANTLRRQRCPQRPPEPTEGRPDTQEAPRYPQPPNETPKTTPRDTRRLPKPAERCPGARKKHPGEPKGTQRDTGSHP